MNILKQSTAATIKFGPLIDDTDGKTAETGLTISQADIRLSKNGGDFAQTHNAAGATHDENGYYDIPLDTTDTGTLGRLRVAVSKSGALPVWQDFIIVAANVYDSIVSGSDKLDVNAAELGGTAQTGNDVGADVNEILTDTGTTLDTLIKDIPTVAEFEARTKPTADYFDPTADTVATVTNLTNLPTMPADWLTASGLKADAVAEIQAGLALEATLTAMKGIGWTNETLVALMTAIETIVPGSGATAQEVWEYVTRTLTDPDSYKADVSGLALEATLTAIKGAGWTTETLAAIDVLIDAIKVKTDLIPASPAAVGSAMTLANDAITAAKISADAITEIQSGLAKSADLQDVEDKVDVIALDTTTEIPASITALSGKLDTIDNFLDTEIAAILEDTGTTLPATLATIEGNVDTVDAVVDAIKLKTDNLPASPAATGAAMTLTAAYDKAKDDVLTPLGVVDGIVDSIKLKTDNIPASPAPSGEYNTKLAAIQADLDNPAQYKADVSGLATTSHMQEVEDKIDAIDTTSDAIKTKTDQLVFTTPNKVDASATVDTTGLATSDALETVDGIVDAIKIKTDQLTFTVPGSVDATSTIDVSGLIDNLLAANIEGTLDLKDVLRIVLAFASGVTDGGGSAVITYKDVAGTKDRITWTVNTSGDRLSSAVDGSD
jgi:hypothetical protein